MYILKAKRKAVTQAVTWVIASTLIVLMVIGAMSFSGVI